jgi:lipoate-protein ligase A
MSKLKVFLSDSYNPHLNLATEEWIFHNLDPSSQILFLWRNEETVVIGRNQNPWSECNLLKMKNDRVHLARRTTGGGAVFHDLGNTNFTFLSPRESYARENNVQIILNTLREFGVTAEASGRNDLLIPFPDGPRKFSGSAYREKKDRAFHHGTLLLHADLTRLGQYLTPNPKKLKAKGKESVRARVANLNELVPTIQHIDIVGAMVRSFEAFYQGKAEITNLTFESLQKIPELDDQYKSLASFDWLYGNTLEFNQQIDDYIGLGFFDFQFQIQEAHIQSLKIFTDCLYPSLVEDLTLFLEGQKFESESIRQAVKFLRVKYPNLQDELTELENWLAVRIEN